MAESASTALGVLFLYSVLMFSLPFVAFFGAKDIAEKYTSLDRFGVTVTSVVASVVTVNVIILFYVSRAIGTTRLEYHQELMDKMD
ncbi:Williams-beuren syndrome critical region protein [Nesidiocoris tenuis]|uniref:Williams-beuren syndrome critical region protein n=1 Tax=Nesidiocoris tenuis TaxID=355587 RepID=A0ABN7AK31_9HEMI|nr:Williams-beuren syndrome critical region protein [Nesidiocoris tenuis]